jgi:hypothetical protein
MSVSAASLSSAIVSHSSPWVASLRWDAFWFLSGFWLPVLILLPASWSESLIWTLTLFFWIAHRLSSVYLAWCVGEYQPVVQQNKTYFIGLPLLLLVGLSLFLLLPAPFWGGIPRLWRFGLVAAVDYFWSLYHFARQHYGVLAVYRSRQSRSRPSESASALLRWDWVLCLWVSGVFSLCMDLHYGEFEPLRLWQAWLGGENTGLWTAQGGLLKSLLSAAVLGFWGFTLYYYRQQQQSIARILYASSLCGMTLLSFYVSPLLYFVLLQVQHWLVSLGLTQHMATRSRAKPSGLWYGGWQRVNALPLGALGVLMLCSVLLMPWLETDAYLVQQLQDPLLLARWQENMGLYLLGLLAFWSAGVHYLYDRGVFRFSDPRVRKAALPLLDGASPRCSAVKQSVG